MKNVICMKWGDLYNDEYVNKLYHMVKRNTTGPVRFVCLTDNPKNLDSEIETYECPSISIKSPENQLGWRKITLFSDAEYLFGLKGNWLFLDLDVVITSNIDAFFEYKIDDNFIVMKNWSQPKKMIGNTSIFRFKIGTSMHLLNELEQNSIEILDKYPNSQTYVSENIEKLNFWPDEWCLLFKINCTRNWPLNFILPPKLPKKSKIVAFPGVPNPHQALKGIWPVKAKWKKIYKYIKPTKWVTEHWR